MEGYGESVFLPGFRESYPHNDTESIPTERFHGQVD